MREKVQRCQSRETLKRRYSAAIEKQAKAAEVAGAYTNAAEALHHLAYAWRAVVGGTQPGSSIVKKD